MINAIETIQNDHFNLVRVLKALEAAVGLPNTDKTTKPDFDLIEQILYYIRIFPDNFHHPKEERFLFPALIASGADIRATIETLEQQHAEGAQLIANLNELVRTAERTYPEGMEALQDAVCVYTHFQREHIGLEEREILPVAAKILTDSDWESINRAFSKDSDPLFGENLETGFQTLLQRIVG